MTHEEIMERRHKEFNQALNPFSHLNLQKALEFTYFADIDAEDLAYYYTDNVGMLGIKYPDIVLMAYELIKRESIESLYNFFRDSNVAYKICDMVGESIEVRGTFLDVNYYIDDNKLEKLREAIKDTLGALDIDDISITLKYFLTINRII